MTDAVRIFAKRIEPFGLNRLICEADTIAVALSGGADSSLLLCLMKEYLKNSGTHLVACHLNHMIRGDEAYRDEEFSRKLSESLDVPFYVKRVDIPLLAVNGAGIEETARHERYAFFEELSSSLDDHVLVATAHNADDNLETVLFNLVRGTGATGLCGIPPIRDNKYIRPLLGYTSEEIRLTAERLGINYVVDSTNLSVDYTRNKIRHLVIPHLRELNPNVCDAALRMSDSMRRDKMHFERAVGEVLSHASDDGRISRELLCELDTAILPRVLAAFHDAFVPRDTPSLESVHLRSAEQLLREHDGNFELSIPGGISFICRDGMCSFEAKVSECNNIDTSVTPLKTDVPMRKNGYIIFATERKISQDTTQNENIYNLSIHTKVKFDTIKDELGVRTRMPGDAYRFGGMTRRLKRLFSDNHISHAERARLPVICDAEGILWVPHFPVRDNARADGNEKALRIFCIKEEHLNDIEEILELYR